MKIIAFEGLDGSGKTTQIRLLEKHLQELGFKAYTFGFPNYNSPIGKLIREYLLGEASYDANTFDLLQTADKQAMQEWMKWIETNDKVDFLILDRYTTSQLVYGNASGVELEWIKSLQKKLRMPDFEVYIDINVELSMERSGKTDRYEKDEHFLTTVRGNYWKYLMSEAGFLVNGDSPVNTVHMDIVRALETVLPELYIKEKGSH